jgi:predicted nucleic acid-binding protein
MKVFLDTNILIDFISGRKPFADDSMVFFQLAYDGEIELMVSDLTIVNTIYILHRLHYSQTDIYETLEEINAFLTITPIGAETINYCLRGRYHDFEDAVQYYSALKAGADYVITRNGKDFPHDATNVLSPLDFFRKNNITF